MSDAIAPSEPVQTPAKLSPAMQQYRLFKSQHPGYCLFFRMGDFYEMFWEDAQLAARVLGVALTSRNKGIAGRNSDGRGAVSCGRGLSAEDDRGGA